MWPIYLTAGSVSAILSLVEVSSSKIGVTRQATRWILLRLAIDGLVGAGAYLTLSATGNTTPNSLSKWFVAVIAGVGGAAMARSYFVARGPSGQKFGLVAFHDRLRNWTDDRIADSVSRAGTAWLRDIAIPRMRTTDIDELIEDTITYLEYRGRGASQINKTRAHLLSVSSQGIDTDAMRYQLYKVVIAAGAKSVLSHYVKKRAPEFARRTAPVAAADR
jgi:hypothetical protein